MFKSQIPIIHFHVKSIAFSQLQNYYEIRIACRRINLNRQSKWNTVAMDNVYASNMQRVPLQPSQNADPDSIHLLQNCSRSCYNTKFKPKQARKLRRQLSINSVSKHILFICVFIAAVWFSLLLLFVLICVSVYLLVVCIIYEINIVASTNISKR